MAKFLGIKNNRINIASDKAFKCEGIQVIELPAYLLNVPVADLITNYRFKDDKFISKFTEKPINELKIAFVGNWKMRCGISTYSENLWGEISKSLTHFKLFIEENDQPTGVLNEIGGKTIPAEDVIVCWKRGESLQHLTAEIKKYEPDIVFLQHEYGLFPNACYWLSLMNQLSDYRIIVTMHSIFHHRDKTIVEASIPEIITHLQSGYDVLKKEKQIPGKVYVIPHGCFPCTNKEKLWNFYKTDKTFLQSGFGFKYKGFENSIKAAGIIKKQFPDVFLTILYSESPFNKVEHQIYYNELMQLIEQLGLQENVAIIRGFQSDATLDSYLRTNKVAVFPYISQQGHEVFGASGAARTAMSANIPLITTSVPHFSDLPTIKADTVEQIAVELIKLFSNPALINEQLLKQEQYLIENSWKNIANRHLKLFETHG